MNNRIKILKYFFLALILSIFFLPGCEENGSSPEVPPAVIEKGERKIGFHLTEGAGDTYDDVFLEGKSFGMEIVPLTIYWSDIETDNGFNVEFFKLIELYYPFHNAKVSLCLTPIAAISKSTPTDLIDKSFDDPLLINRFKTLLDTVKNYVSLASLNNLIIGNEVDLYLSQIDSGFAKYKVFFEEVRGHAKNLWGNELKVGVENTWGALSFQNINEIIALNEQSDHVVFSYYPLESNFEMKSPSSLIPDLESAINLYSGRTFFIEEIGCATSEVCASSEDLQSEFFEELFKFWDNNAAEVEYIGVLWFTDLSQESVDFFINQYGMSGAQNALAFGEYLRTLGIKKFDGTQKKGYHTLLESLKKRGW